MGRPYTRSLKFIIASGPTREPVDPVRFLSNYSTGVMGRSLVAAARARGHRVEWVECPRQAETALELEKVLRRLVPKNDVLVMAAAVADARPARVSRTKIKKEKLSAVRLVKNPDILAGLARRKKKGQVFVGFGLESEGLESAGRRKLEKKGLELIVLQRVTAKSAPFGDKTIDAVLMDACGRTGKRRAITKKKLAEELVKRAEAIYASKHL